MQRTCRRYLTIVVEIVRYLQCAKYIHDTLHIFHINGRQIIRLGLMQAINTDANPWLITCRT